MLKIKTKALVFAACLGTLFSCRDEPQLTTKEKITERNARVAPSGSNVRLLNNKFIVLSNSDQMTAELASQLSNAGGNIVADLKTVGMVVINSNDPNFKAKAGRIIGVRSVINDFSAQWISPNIQSVELNDEAFGNPPNSGDDDIRFDLQWGHDAINAPEAWNLGHRGQGTVVAVLDGGFDLDHADLAPNIIDSKSFVPGEGPQFVGSNGSFSHGTHTAGIIGGADNSKGIIGVAPLTKLVLVKVLSDAGSGSFSWLLEGILYATMKGADVINMSLGAALPRNGKFLDEDGNVVSETKEVQELLVAIQRVTSFARKNGVTLIASAGNDANNGDTDKSLMHIPSGVPAVISISATAPIGWAQNPTTNLDVFTDYSNYGSADIAFAAPGGNVWDAVPNTSITVAGVTRPAWVFDLVFSAGFNNAIGNTTGTWAAGTSMAGPHAAGVAALIIGKNGGSMNPSAVEAKMRASADDLGKPGQDPFYGYGRVNAERAVK